MCLDGELYSATVADISSRDALIYKKPIRSEQHDSQWLNGSVDLRNVISFLQLKCRLFQFCKLQDSKKIAYCHYCLCFVLIHFCFTSHTCLRQLVPFFTANDSSLHNRGKAYGSSVRSCMLHRNETWLRKENRQALDRAEKRMIRWICGAQHIASYLNSGLKERLGLYFFFYDFTVERNE